MYPGSASLNHIARSYIECYPLYQGNVCHVTASDVRIFVKQGAHINQLFTFSHLKFTDSFGFKRSCLSVPVNFRISNYLILKWFCLVYDVRYCKRVIVRDTVGIPSIVSFEVELKLLFSNVLPALYFLRRWLVSSQ